MNEIVRSKVFRIGDGVAVRLPDTFGIEDGAEVDIVGSAREIVMRPVRPVLTAAERQARWLKTLDKLRALGPVGEIEVRETIEFPERPGL